VLCAAAEEAEVPSLDTASLDPADAATAALTRDQPAASTAAKQSLRRSSAQRLSQLLQQFASRARSSGAAAHDGGGQQQQPQDGGDLQHAEDSAGAASTAAQQAQAVDDGTTSSTTTTSGSSLAARVQSLAVTLDLQRRWVGYQLQQLGRAAGSPLSSARQAVRDAALRAASGDGGVMWARLCVRTAAYARHIR
jgi:hypothetical protein